MDNAEKVKKFSHSIDKIKEELKKDVVGQEEIVENVITAIIAGGNVLLEGVPGVGKTRLVRSLGRTLHLPFSRIQFTPDLMPSDVTGTNVIEKDEKGRMNMVFQRDLSSPTLCLRTKLTEPRRKRSRLCSKLCRNIKLRLQSRPISSTNLSLCSQPKTLSSRTELTLCPKRRWTALCLSLL